MAVIKDGVENTSLIIQEGVPTVLSLGEEAVEPVVYSVLSKPVGMFFRVNKGATSNLNSKGMRLVNDFNLSEAQEVLSLLVASFANIAIGMELASLK